MNPNRPRSVRRLRAREHRASGDEAIPTFLVGYAQTERQLAAAHAEVRRQLLELLGDSLVGEILTTHLEGEEALERLRVFWVGAAEKEAAHYRRIRGSLREYGGFLVVGWVPARVAV